MIEALKNKNILSRFDTKVTGSRIVKYSLKKKDGTRMTMICMDGESLNSAKKIAFNQFGEGVEVFKG